MLCNRSFGVLKFEISTVWDQYIGSVSKFLVREHNFVFFPFMNSLSTIVIREKRKKSEMQLNFLRSILRKLFQKFFSLKFFFYSGIKVFSLLIFYFLENIQWFLVLQKRIDIFKLAFTFLFREYCTRVFRFLFYLSQNLIQERILESNQTFFSQRDF